MFLGKQEKHTQLSSHSPLTSHKQGNSSTDEPVDPTLTLYRNDGRRTSLRILIELKGVISKQLPKMPKEYITKLLFDPKHESIVFRMGGKAIAGACFRCFPGRGFAELVFLAVQQNYRECRLGSRIVDALKEQLQKRKVRLLLTYADLSAVGFFKKQAFEKAYETSSKEWSGYIKAYEGGELMQCRIDGTFKYTKFREIVSHHKIFLLGRVKQLLSCETSYKVESQERKVRNGNSKQASLDRQLNSQSNESQKSALTGHSTSHSCGIEELPGVLDSGWCSQLEAQLQTTQEISLVLAGLQAIQNISKQPIFAYLSQQLQTQAVCLPLTWATLEKKVINGMCYPDQKELCSEIRRIIALLKNCRGDYEAKEFEEAEAKAQTILQMLIEKRLLYSIDNAFKEEKIGRGKKGKRI